MKSKNILLYFMTVILTALALFFAKEAAGGELRFSFLVTDGKSTEEIRAWQRDDGGRFVFLPGYANLSEVKLLTNRSIRFDDLKMTYGTTCGDLELGRPYQLFDGPTEVGRITFMQSAKLPALYLNTSSGSMENVHREKGVKEAGSLHLYTEAGIAEYTGRLESVQIRGNNYSPKRQYSLKLPDERDLLGMGKAQKWVLLSDTFDATHLRNKIVYDFADRAGLRYSPETRWVDLYLNGEYAGVYLLSERNEVHPQRVDIAQEGSFLVSLEFEDRLQLQNLPYIRTGKSAALRIHNASMDDEAIAKMWESVENAVYDEAGIDPVTGKHWTELIDLDSWARKYLVEEVFGNIDGGRVSQFFYVDGNDPSRKIYAGPVWDYDMALANPSVFSEIYGIRYQIPASCFYVNRSPENFGSFWYYPLYQDPIFYRYVTELYEREYLPLLTQLLEGGIGVYAREISDAVRLDQFRWGTDDAELETEKLQAYLKNRVGFLNGVWLDQKEYISLVTACAWRITNYALSPGETIPELPALDGWDWVYEDTGLPVDLTVPVADGMRIEMIKREQPPKSASVSEEEPDPIPEEPTAYRRKAVPFILMMLGLGGMGLVDFSRAKRSVKNERTKVR